ncbi:MAG: 50S ribosomal protein L25/general stress protein Ctc [Burkholderiaceae bacterium]|nr:50S ribosomal protein L25/general stress protein Ctc [Burkholderiaceae bacterium]
MKVVANVRKEQGTGASRRLRRAGHVPGIVYGGKGEAVPVSLEHNPLYHALRVEAFHSSILDLEIGDERAQVLLRDVQWHPYKPQVLHVDFQRVAADEKITVKVPLHFVNEESSPAVKLSAGIIGRVITEVEVSCLPAALPSFIEVDLSQLEAGKSVHVNDIVFPQGVTPLLPAGENPVVVTVTIPGAAEEEPAVAPAAAAAPAAPAAPRKP